ncbi:MAG: branched-chain amino acid ABC transporter permease, partial [Oscillospiraceae bacterium]
MKEKKSFNFLAPFESFCDKYKIPLSIAIGAFLIVIPLLGVSRVAMRNLVMILLYAMLGMGLNVLLGYTGQVSLGHAGFYAIGAYTSAVLTTTFGWNFWISALCGALLAALIGLLLGLPTLRLSGTYLTIVTLG